LAARRQIGMGVKEDQKALQARRGSKKTRKTPEGKTRRGKTKIGEPNGEKKKTLPGKKERRKPFKIHDSALGVWNLGKKGKGRGVEVPDCIIGTTKSGGGKSTGMRLGELRGKALKRQVRVTHRSTTGRKRCGDSRTNPNILEIRCQEKWVQVLGRVHRM